ncbi:MAG: DUF2391 domain-containing protein [Rhodothermales bacterium]
MPDAAAASSPTTPAPIAPALIEVGWVLAGGLDEDELAACRTARLRMAKVLRAGFPGFRWHFPVAHRSDFPIRRRVEPVDLLDLGVAEREVRSWDFALVVTGAELESYYKPFALATPSKATAVACLSTARLDLGASDDDDEDDARAQTALLAGRLFALAMHVFGDLCGIPHADEPESFMWIPSATADLDDMRAYTDDDHEALQEELADVADVRLEETTTHSRIGPALFYLRTVLINGRDVLGSLRQIRPWLFPLQFSKLTLAAASTLVVLLITEEAWTIGTSQSPAWIATFATVALGLTSLYIVKRQHLLIRRERGRLTEQVAVANVTVSLAIVLGMATMFVVLFGLTLGFSMLLFPDPLVERWTGRPATLELYATLAGFSATLGLLIGALGASFEDEAYFRHVTYVDEEV